MPGTIFLSEEDKLVLNLEALKDDYSKCSFKHDKYGAVYVLCPRGRYSLREYLSRKVGMYSAQKKYDDFKLNELIIRNQDDLYRIDMKKKEKEFNDFLWQSLKFYGIVSSYYDDDDLSDREKEIALYETFVYNVYNGEYDRAAVISGIMSAGDENKSAKQAAWMAEERRQRGEDCDMVDIYEEAMQESADVFREASKEECTYENYMKTFVPMFHKSCIDKVDEVNGRLDDIGDNILRQSTIEQAEQVLDNESSMISKLQFEKIESMQRDKFKASGFLLPTPDMSNTLDGLLGLEAMLRTNRSTAQSVAKSQMLQYVYAATQNQAANEAVLEVSK